MMLLKKFLNDGTEKGSTEMVLKKFLHDGIKIILQLWY